METPKRKVNKLSITYRSSTPKKERNIPLDNDYSPLFMSNTQDCIDSVDVVWDWNSPQAKGNIKAEKQPPKRLYASKPSPSINPDVTKPVASFNQLKEQLELLRNQLILDNAEKVRKDDTSFIFNNKSESPRRSIPVLPKPKNLLTKSFSSESLGNSFFEDDFNISDIVTKSKVSKMTDKTADYLDIDIALNEFQDEDYELLSQAIPIPLNSKEVKVIESKPIFKRTISSINTISKSECRRSNEKSVTKQYSQDEIEKKRKLALAKLEERRIEDIIEKKRQQALMRLESSRKKNLRPSTVAMKRYNSS